MNKPLRVMPRWLRVGRKALRKYWQLAGLMGAVLLTGCDPKLEEVDASVVGLTIQIATNLVIIQAGTNASAYLSEANFPVVTATHNLPTNGYSFTSLSAPRYYYPGTGTGYDFPLGRTQVKVGVRLIATAHNNGINNGIDYDSGVSTSFTVQVIGIPQTPPPASPLPPVGFTNLASFGINTTNAFANGVLGDGSTTNIGAPLNLIEGSDGFLYGVTKENLGDFPRVRNIVKFSKTGTNAQELLRFDNTAPNYGYFPIPYLARVRIIENGTNRTLLIGADQGGPPAGFVNGRIFRLNEDGSGFQVLHGFQPNIDRRNGAEPATLTVDQFGFIYGTTRLGGYVTGTADDAGLIFRLWWSDSHFEILRRFRQTVRNNSGVLISSNDQLFGAGKSGDGGSAGSLFTTDNDGGFYGGFQTNFYTFSQPPTNPGPEGPYLTGPQGGLVEATNGFLYGAHGFVPGLASAFPSLTTNLSYYYKIAKDGTNITYLAYLPLNAAPAPKSLVLGSDGLLYGYLFISTTSLHLVALHPDTGVLDFVKELYNIPFPNTVLAGGLVSSSDGALYGTVMLGGTYNKGYLFRFMPTNGVAMSLASSRAPLPIKPPASGDDKSDTTTVSAASLTAASVITLSTNYPGLNLGRAVAISNDWLVVGVPFSTNLAYQGAAYVFRRSGTNWNPEATLSPPGADAVRLFGFAAAISSNTVVISAPGIFGTNLYAGAAYVFLRTNNAWQQTAKLAGLNLPGDEFGEKVGIHSDRIIVGAPGETNGGTHAGGAWIFLRNGTNWPSQAHLTAPGKTANDYFGAAVAINGDYAVVGAPKGRELDIPLTRGDAHLFRFITGSWSFRESFETDYSYAGDYFGASVAMSTDQVVVGMPGALPFDATDAKRDRRGAIVFNRVVNDWPQSARLVPDQHRGLEMFGASVAFEGNRITVGAPHDPEFVTGSPGSAYVFAAQSNKWTQAARLQVAGGQTNDGFGFVVAHSGDQVAVSALAQVNSNDLSGAVHLFDLGQVRLSITPGAQGLLLDWFPSFLDFTLQSSAELGSDANWLPVQPAPTNIPHLIQPGSNVLFFRLTKP